MQENHADSSATPMQQLLSRDWRLGRLNLFVVLSERLSIEMPVRRDFRARKSIIVLGSWSYSDADFGL